MGRYNATLTDAFHSQVEDRLQSIEGVLKGLVDRFDKQDQRQADETRKQQEKMWTKQVTAAADNLVLGFGDMDTTMPPQ